jgi:hypothetical protein
MQLPPAEQEIVRLVSKRLRRRFTERNRQLKTNVERVGLYTSTDEVTYIYTEEYGVIVLL